MTHAIVFIGTSWLVDIGHDGVYDRVRPALAYFVRNLLLPGQAAEDVAAGLRKYLCSGVHGWYSDYLYAYAFESKLGANGAWRIHIDSPPHLSYGPDESWTWDDLPALYDGAEELPTVDGAARDFWNDVVLPDARHRIEHDLDRKIIITENTIIDVPTN